MDVNDDSVRDYDCFFPAMFPSVARDDKDCTEKTGYQKPEIFEDSE